MPSINPPSPCGLYIYVLYICTHDVDTILVRGMKDFVRDGWCIISRKRCIRYVTAKKIKITTLFLGGASTIIIHARLWTHVIENFLSRLVPKIYTPISKTIPLYPRMFSCLFMTFFFKCLQNKRRWKWWCQTADRYTNETIILIINITSTNFQFIWVWLLIMPVSFLLTLLFLFFFRMQTYRSCNYIS